MVCRKNKDAEMAQIVSDEVASVKVFRTGDNATRARKTSIEDLNTREPVSTMSELLSQ